MMIMITSMLMIMIRIITTMIMIVRVVIMINDNKRLATLNTRCGAPPPFPSSLQAVGGPG